jgi:hypothetical protein
VNSAPYATPSRRNCNGVRIHREFHLHAQITFVHFPVTEHAPFTLLGEAEQFTVGNDGYNYDIPFFIVINPFCNLDTRFFGDLYVTQPVCHACSPPAPFVFESFAWSTSTRSFDAGRLSFKLDNSLGITLVSTSANLTRWVLTVDSTLHTPSQISSSSPLEQSPSPSR